MKKALLILLAASGLVACKKNKVAPVTNVIGKWELHRRHGGNINPPDTTYQAGNGNILLFNADSIYKTYSGGTLSDSGRFHIARHAYKSGGIYYDELSFNSYTNYFYTINAAVVLDLVSVSGSALTITPLMPDASTTQYYKLSN